MTRRRDRRSFIRWHRSRRSRGARDWRDDEARRLADLILRIVR
jgi:hypothetical protein